MCSGVPFTIPDAVKVDGGGEEGSIVVLHVDQVREVDEFIGLLVLRDGGEREEKEREEEEREV